MGSTCIGYELLNDLDFDENGDGEITSADATYWNGGEGWQPIGGADSVTLTLDGNGHTIANLFINAGLSKAGLFRILDGTSAIRNLGLVDVNITVTGSSDGTGALAGDLDGSATRVYSTGRISGGETSGGLAGGFSGTITASYSTVSVTVTGNSVGGLVGSMGAISPSTITSSYATGPVTGADYVGGLAGRLFQSGNIADSYATGPVSGTGSNVGGMRGGAHANATITSSTITTPTPPGKAEARGPKRRRVCNRPSAQPASSPRGARTIGTSALPTSTRP